MTGLRLVFGAELSTKIKIQAFGSFALSVLRYRFEIFKWRQEEMQKLDRKTRKALTIHGQRHQKKQTQIFCMFPPPPKNREKGA